uniref:Uncharacterized protein n=1 Tax=Anguilla anguilla TaxID=7936 RepID=A0A0E9R7F3_ANGAN
MQLCLVPHSLRGQKQFPSMLRTHSLLPSAILHNCAVQV